jgi:hypothetical protein
MSIGPKGLRDVSGLHERKLRFSETVKGLKAPA